MMVNVKATNGKMWVLTLHDGNELLERIGEIMEHGVDRIEITFSHGSKILTLTNF